MRAAVARSPPTGRPTVTPLLAIAGDPPGPAAGGFGFTDTAAALLSLTALFAYLNHRFVRLPPTAGVMALALGFSLLVTTAGQVAPPVREAAVRLVRGVDFNRTVLHGLLGFLLFAGALHTDLAALARRRALVGVLATVGVAVSAGVVGGLAYLLLDALGLPARPLYCLMFGALIAPTDPIAVLAMLKRADAPKTLEATIAGESLFNDGVGVVLFLALVHAATAGQGVTLGGLAGEFAREAAGGVGFGLALGGLFFLLFRSVDAYPVEVLLSLALVAGGYALAGRLGVSAPLAVVVAGLIVGNPGRAHAMSDTTRDRLDGFWELVDEILNAVLFVLMGLEVLLLSFNGRYLAAGLLLVPVVLLARGVSVAGPVVLFRRHTPIARYTIRLLTWGGLRGGLSVAMALAVPASVGEAAVPERGWMLTATYVVVGFSVLVQGTTVGPIMRRWLAPPPGT